MGSAAGPEMSIAAAAPTVAETRHKMAQFFMANLSTLDSRAALQFERSRSENKGAASIENSAGTGECETTALGQSRGKPAGEIVATIPLAGRDWRAVSSRA
jgi:hypothetical protein